MRLAGLTSAALSGVLSAFTLAGCGCDQPPARAQSPAAQVGVAYLDTCLRSPRGLPDFDGAFWTQQSEQQRLPAAYSVCIRGAPAGPRGTFTLVNRSTLLFSSPHSIDVRFIRRGPEVPNPCG